MKRFVEGIQSLALTLGAPGLFFVAFLDSSFLSLPEINDLLLVLLVIEHPARMPLYATCATLGSIAGCVTLYALGRKGGEAFVSRRFTSSRINSAIRSFHRYGVLAILVPSLFPPPAPFKVFVLLAGVAGLGTWRFVTAVAIGRGLRYFGEGVLTVLYGEQALGYIRDNGRTVAVWTAGLIVAGFVAYVMWRRFGEKEKQLN